MGNTQPTSPGWLQVRQQPPTSQLDQEWQIVWIKGAMI
jgi:hypothetical protein